MKKTTGGFLAGLLLSSLLAMPASAVVHTVNQVGFDFVPAELTINVGDTVEWVWSGGLHTVTSGTDLADPDLGLQFDEPLDSANTLVSHTFNQAGEVPYICRIHVALGMTGIIRVATGVTHTVDQVGNTFVPDDITIEAGDTVEWIWSSGIHTVTNGIDFDDPNFGVLFDAPLDAANPTFSYTFFTAGDVPYFCQPHLFFGMTGTVRVQSPTPVQESPRKIGFTLDQNSPNPFNPKTVMSFSLPEAVPVNLRIYDLSGRLVRTVLDGSVLEAGGHQAVWDGRDDLNRIRAAGIYLYRLEANSFSETKAMTLLK